MRHLPALLTVPLLSAVLVAQAGAQNAGTCDDPIFVSTSGEVVVDTRGHQDQENFRGECGDSLATGADVVFGFGGMPVSGVVTWAADYSAIVYSKFGGCPGHCGAASTSGNLEFSTGYNWDDGGPSWDPVLIVADGLRGESGVITLRFEFSDANPVLPGSWGRIKSRY